jgi:uncharacterized repeat protein (TIGR03803 family)
LSGLVLGNDGNFYGTTQYYGVNGVNSGSTVFKITPGGTLTTLYSFCAQTNCADGGSPNGLIQGTDGQFYGTTPFGGANCLAQGGCGTVFKVTPGGTLTTLYSFCSQTNCADGNGPLNALVQATDGNFYGTTIGGGNSACTSPVAGCGTVFKITPTGNLTTLHSFDGTDGNAAEGLAQATNGIFYGTTDCIGTAFLCFLNSGTVFSLEVGLGPFVRTVPAAGSVAETVTILGTDLSDATHVRFGNKEAAFTVVSDTEIQTSVPAGATTGFVSVNRHGPRLKSNVPFQVVP